MTSQSNSWDTGGEDSEQLNTSEEELTENDREALEDSRTDPEDEDIESEGKEQMESLVLIPRSLDDYVPDASSPQQCRKRETGHVCVCKDCDKPYFPPKNENEKEPEPEKEQRSAKKQDKEKGEGKKEKKHSHTRAVRNKEWRPNMPCSSIDAKIKQRNKAKGPNCRGNINLKAVDRIVAIHSGARVCTSSFYTHNHYHACLALSLFYDNGYMQVSGNKNLIDIIMTKEVRDALAKWAREEKKRADNPTPEMPSAEDKTVEGKRKQVFKDYASIPIMLMSESEYAERKKASPQDIKLMMTSMIKAHNLKQGKGNGSSSFNY